ncbi:MAG TPA: TolC family protein [Balneolales bacterium]|nr:TolC family protein [Balneolales bacterium]
MKLLKYIIVLVLFSSSLITQPIMAQDQHPLTLQEVIQLALKNNSLIKQSNFGVEAAEFQIAEQQSGFYPNVLIRSSVSHANEAPRIPIEFKSDTVLARQGTENTFTARVELNQMIYDFGKTTHSVKAARYGASAQKYSYRQQINDVTVEVKQQFYRSLAYQKMDSIYRSIIPLSETLQKINEEKLKNGVALSPEVLRSQADLQNAIVQMTSAKNELNKSYDRLLMLTGIPTSEIRTTGNLPVIQSTPNFNQLYGHLYNIALQNREDIRQTTFLAKQQQEIARAYSAQNYPSLMLQSDFSYFGPDAFGYYSSLSSRGLKNYNWRVGIGFTFNLFDGSRMKSQKMRALVLQRQYEEGTDQQRLQIGTEIKTLLNELENLQLLIKSNQVVLKQARANLKVVEVSYQNGAIPQIDYIQAQIPVANALANLEKSKFEMLHTLMLLEGTVGTDLHDTIHY